MQRNRYAPQLPLGLGLLLIVGACSVPTQRESLDATARLVAGQVAAPLEWRLDPKADAEALQRAEALLIDGLTLEEAIRVAFLASPDLQLALEEVEISRADFVAATTASNPVLVLGSREPSGALASFYPERTITLGVLQSVIDLLRIPGRRDAARHDVERARHEAAYGAIRLAAQVAQAWIDYSAALQVLDLRQRALAIVQLNYDNLLAAPAGDADHVETLEVERGNLLDRKGQVIRAKLEVARTRAALGERLGIAGWRDDWDVQPSLQSLPDLDPNPVTEERAAMERRLDLLAGNQAFEARLRVLANHRRFRWLNQLDLGLFRDQATGGTEFIGPNVAIELPLFDQRLATLLNADSQLRSALRSLYAARLAARSEIRTHAAEMTTARLLLEQIELEIQPGQQQLLASPVGGDPDDPSRLGQRLAILTTEEGRVELLRDYWRSRSALAFAVGDWGALSGLR
jgi:outer membrane protein TolC